MKKHTSMPSRKMSFTIVHFVYKYGGKSKKIQTNTKYLKIGVELNFLGSVDLSEKTSLINEFFSEDKPATEPTREISPVNNRIP